MKALLLYTLFVSQALATTITYAGADLNNGARWRTASVTKSMDPDGNNIYGSDGFLLLTSPAGVVASLPGYISNIQQVAPFSFYGGHAINPLYVDVDNPSAPGVVKPGAWFGTSGNVDVFARIFVRNKVNFRLGVLVDVFDFADVSPLTLRVDQIFVPNGADSGFRTVNLEGNRDADWYFFDISADAGDVFHVSGQNWNQGIGGPAPANAIAGLSFDTIPEPSTYGLIGLGLLALRLSSAGRSASSSRRPWSGGLRRQPGRTL